MSNRVLGPATPFTTSSAVVLARDKVIEGEELDEEEEPIPSSASATPTLEGSDADADEDPELGQMDESDGSLMPDPLPAETPGLDAPMPSSASATPTSEARCRFCAAMAGVEARASREAALDCSRNRYSSSMVVMFLRSARGGRRSSTSD